MWGFDDPIRLVGVRDNPWTNARGKTCPGRTRIAQFLNEVLPAFAEVDVRDARIAELEADVAAQKALQRKHRETSRRLRAQSKRLREDLVAVRARLGAVPPPVPSVSVAQHEQALAAAAAAQGQVQELREAMRVAADNLAAALGG